MSGDRGVTRWLQARRTGRRIVVTTDPETGAVTNIDVPEGVVIVLPRDESIDLNLYGATTAERKQAPVVSGTPRATQSKKKRKGKRA